MEETKPSFSHPQTQSAFPTQYSTQQQQTSPDLDALKQQVDDLALLVANLIRTHKHDGASASRVNLLDVLLDMKRPIDKNLGIFRVVSAAPSATPIDAFDQIQVYVNGATLRLYWYDWNAAAWHYVTATA